MSRDAVLCLKQLHLTLFYKIRESSYVPPHQYARKTQSNAVSRYQPRFHAECSTVFRKTPINSKLIPQFDSTNYLALISRTCSTRISCQTFSNSWVEQNCPWLLDYYILCQKGAEGMAKTGLVYEKQLFQENGFEFCSDFSDAIIAQIR